MHCVPALTAVPRKHAIYTTDPMLILFLLLPIVPLMMLVPIMMFAVAAMMWVVVVMNVAVTMWTVMMVELAAAIIPLMMIVFTLDWTQSPSCLSCRRSYVCFGGGLLVRPPPKLIKIVGASGDGNGGRGVCLWLVGVVLGGFFLFYYCCCFQKFPRRCRASGRGG